MSDKTWCVYKHTFPNGRVYIGVSCNPEERWDNGMGYAGNGQMFRDIVHYGWRNIVHEILLEGLTEAEAKKKEMELISSYGIEGRKKTYNRVHAQYERVEKTWLDLKLTADAIKRHNFDFMALDDFWMEAYIQQIGARPFGTDLTEDGVVMNFFLTDGNGNMTHRKLKAKYPEDGMTFREVHKWLYTTPKFEEVETVTAKMPDEWVQILKEAP